MVGDHRRLLRRAAVLQVGRDAGGPKGVIADPGVDARRPCSPLGHGVSVRLRERRARQEPRAPTSANMAPCGSRHWTIQLPPGTSIGPLRIWPPLAVTRVAAASMSLTVK